jgi:hypothetical protein
MMRESSLAAIPCASFCRAICSTRR